MQISIKKESLNTNGTTIKTAPYKCTVIAEGEKELVDEFYKYVSKFIDYSYKPNKTK